MEQASLHTHSAAARSARRQRFDGRPAVSLSVCGV